MRPSTPLHVAFRNIGDSQDTGEYFFGHMSDAIQWLATKLLETSLATRIVIGMGRSQEDAMRGIQVKGAGAQAVSQDLHKMLAKLFDDSADDQSAEGEAACQAPKIASQSTPRLDGDDYVA